MANVQNSIQNLLKRKSKQARQKAIINKFKDKSFTEGFNDLYEIAIWFRWLLACFSIGTGLYMLTDLFNYVNIYVAAAGSALILIIIELLKNSLTQKAVITFYKSGPSIILLPALLVFASSVYLSFNGVGIAHEQLDNNIILIKTDYSIKQDSIDNYYNKAIEAKEAQLETFKEQVSWKGKINVYDQTVRNTLQRLDSELQHLNLNKNNALSQNDVNLNINLGKAKNKFDYRADLWLCISLIVEGCIIIFLWFISYYEFMEYKEATVFEEVESYELTPNQINTLVRIASLNPQHKRFELNGKFEPEQDKNNDKSQQIGFKPSLNPNDNPNIDISEDQKYLIKYAYVVEKIEEGLNEKSIIKRTGISRSTLYNVKRILNNQTL